MVECAWRRTQKGAPMPPRPISRKGRPNSGNRLSPSSKRGISKPEAPMIQYTEKAVQGTKKNQSLNADLIKRPGMGCPAQTKDSPAFSSACKRGSRCCGRSIIPGTGPPHTLTEQGQGASRSKRSDATYL